MTVPLTTEGSMRSREVSPSGATRETKQSATEGGRKSLKDTISERKSVEACCETGLKDAFLPLPSAWDALRLKSERRRSENR